MKTVLITTGNVRSLLKKLPANSVTVQDITGQLNSFFYPGFLQSKNWHNDYKRYLRGLELRIQRAIANPRNDANKLAPLEGFIERCELAKASCENLHLAPALAEFAALLEEMRLAVFAPEVKTRCKVTPAILQKSWDELRY